MPKLRQKNGSLLFVWENYICTEIQCNLINQPHMELQTKTGVPEQCEYTILIRREYIKNTPSYPEDNKLFHNN